MRIGLAFPDAVGGLHGAFALLAALWERELTGRRRPRRPLAAGDAAGVRRRGGAGREHDRASHRRATATAATTTPRRASTAATGPTRGSPSRSRATPSGGALVDLAARRRARRRSPTPTTPRAAAAHDDIDAAIAPLDVVARPARRGQGAAGDRHRRVPGVHEPRPRPRRAPRGPRLHRRVGPRRRRPPALPGLAVPLRAHAGDDRRRRRCSASTTATSWRRSATTTRRSTSCTRAVSSPTNRPGLIRHGSDVSSDPAGADRRPHRDRGRVGQRDVERLGEQAQVGGRADGDAPGRPGGVVERREVQVEGAPGGDPLAGAEHGARRRRSGRAPRRWRATGSGSPYGRVAARRRRRRRRRGASRSATGGPRRRRRRRRGTDRRARRRAAVG